MFRRSNLIGTWLRGDNKGVTGALVDFRSGLLVTSGNEGEIAGPAG